MAVIQNFFATCPRGLESLLVGELEKLGVTNIEATDGGTSFSGEKSLAWRINLESRVATRVLWRVGRMPYKNEDDIYQAVLTLAWPSWFNVNRRIMVKVSAIKSPLKSLDFITLRIKDAVCDKFRQLVGRRPNVDTRDPEVRIHAFLTATECQLYLDTTGAPLYQRGFRKSSVDAPLRENLAAGIVLLSGWQPDMALFDPMCGSGTFLIEATLIALNIAPGLNRHFAFENMENFEKTVWDDIKTQAQKRVKPASALPIYGSDNDMRAVRATRKNLQAAGFSDVVQVQQADIMAVQAPLSKGILLANPPYGVRIGEEEQLAAMYPLLAGVLKRNFAGWNAFFLTSDTRMPKLMRLSPSRKTPLFNGSLECRLYEFKMVAGSNRKRGINEQQ